MVMRAIDLRSSIAAPVFVAGEVWGALVASTTRDQPLPEGSEHRIGGFADLIGQASPTATPGAGSSRPATRRAAASSASCTRARSSTCWR